MLIRRCALIACLVILTVAVAPRSRAQGPQRCFRDVPGVNACIEGRLLQSWQQNGELPVFGYPLTSAAPELNRDTNQTYTTQWFQRNRFELHPENQPPYDVLLGRLGDDRLRQLGRNWQDLPGDTTQIVGCQFFRETQFNLCNRDPETGVQTGFLTYWRTHGLQDPRLDAYGRSLALFGLPLTRPRMETNANGDTVLTQWFERARFEYHPNTPTPGALGAKVLLGLLGTEVRTGTATPPPPPGPTTPTPTTAPAPGVSTYQVINAYPHDPAAWTQGLVYVDGQLYEGTGGNGASTLRRVDLETGNIVQSYALPDEYFGEGITIVGERVMQLTWQSQVGFVYARDSFALLDTFRYPTEGWGLTYDGQQLIMSDGTATLRFLDPESFAEVGRIDVTDNGQAVHHLNELEYVRGEIYANVWNTDRIARIAPATGNVVGWIDLSGLLQAEDRRAPVDVLNGIAYDARQDRLFVTGKLWPRLFEIKLLPSP